MADLVQNDPQAQISKIGGVIRRNFAPSISFEALIGLLLILLFSLALCWVFRPPNRSEAFTRGLSVFAILAAIVPGKAPVGTTLDRPNTPLSRESRESKDAWLAPVATAHALEVGSTRPSGKVRISIATGESGSELAQRIRQDGLAVTLRDPNTSEVVAFERVYWNPLEISQPYGRYLLEVELPGFRRGRTEITVDKEPQAFDLRMTSQTMVPLSLQRLVPSSKLQLSFNENESVKYRGAEASRRGDYSAAIDYYDKSLAFNSKDSETLNYKGYALYRLGRANEAMPVLKRALEITPSYFFARLNLAKAACKAGRTSLAQEAMLGEPPLAKADLERAIQDGEFTRDCSSVMPDVRRRVGQ